MKKNVILAIIFGILAFGAYQVYEKSRVSNVMSSLSEERAFTVESPELIHKIILERKSGEPLVFEKKGGNAWYLNKKFRADDVVVGYMIHVLTRAKMKSIPSKNAVKNILENMKKNGIEVTVFNNKNEEIKKLTIGSDLQSGDGTYMLLHGFKQPYAVELPSLGGGLRSRFEQPLEKYRDRFIYTEPLEKIQSVTVEYHKDPNASYRIEKNGLVYSIQALSKEVNPPAGTVNQNKIKTYLGFFEELGAELLYNHYEGKATVLAAQPFSTITLVTSDGISKKYQYWDYHEFVHKTGDKNRAVDVAHIGRLFVYTGEDLYTVQTGVFGKIFSAYSYFF